MGGSINSVSLWNLYIHTCLVARERASKRAPRAIIPGALYFIYTRASELEEWLLKFSIRSIIKNFNSFELFIATGCPIPQLILFYSFNFFFITRTVEEEDFITPVVNNTEW